MKEVPKHEQLFASMNANARMGRREKGQVGSEDRKFLGAYGRDTLNDNGELLLFFANNHDLALVNTFFSTLKGGVSYAFIGRDKKRIDYILTRQRDRKLVRNVTVLTNSYGTLRCTPSLPSFPFRTTTLCPHPPSSSTILLKTAGCGPRLNPQWTVGAW